MSEEFNVGDEVRVLRPDSLLVTVSRRVVGRRAVVDRTYARLGGSGIVVVVRFYPKNGRGKQFTLHMDPSMLAKETGA